MNSKLIAKNGSTPFLSRWAGRWALCALAVLSTASCGTSREPVAPAIPPSTAVTSTSLDPPSLPVVIDHGNRQTRRVALTFDSNMTDFMLNELSSGKVASFDNTAAIDELIAMNVPATFFLAGKWMERYPQETQRLASNTNFELGSHSYEHKAFASPCYGLGVLKPQEMAPDITRSFDVLRRFTDHPVRYFRFPGLCQDATSLQAITPADVTVIGGDVTSGDSFQPNVQAIVDHTLKATSNGSIVVMHITGGNTAPLTAKALPDIVKGLRSEGLELVKVSELLKD